MSFSQKLKSQAICFEISLKLTMICYINLIKSMTIKKNGWINISCTVIFLRNELSFRNKSQWLSACQNISYQFLNTGLSAWNRACTCLENVATPICISQHLHCSSSLLWTVESASSWACPSQATQATHCRKFKWFLLLSKFRIFMWKLVKRPSGGLPAIYYGLFLLFC